MKVRNDSAAIMELRLQKDDTVIVVGAEYKQFIVRITKYNTLLVTPFCRNENIKSGQGLIEIIKESSSYFCMVSSLEGWLSFFSCLSLWTRTVPGHEMATMMKQDLSQQAVVLQTPAARNCFS